MVVRLARRAAGLTLAELGARCGYSASTLSRLERGKQPLRDIVVLAAIAEALRIPPQLLGLASPPSRHAPSTGSGSRGARAAAATVYADLDLGAGEDPVRRRELLAGFAGLAGAAPLGPPPALRPTAPAGFGAGLATLFYGPQPAATPVPLAELQAAVTAAQADFQAARYPKLAATLPATIAIAVATRDTAPADASSAASTVLAEAYLVASSLLVKVNDDQLAWATADRAVQAAERGDDPLMLADAYRRVAIVLRRTGRADTGQRLVLTTAHGIEPGPTATPEQLSMYGTLLATAAYTAAVDGNRRTAHDLIDESAAAAARLGYDGNHRFTMFGPTNVALYRISIAQVLGDNGVAVEYAKTVRPSAIRTPERRGRYWIDLARAYHQWGKPESCYQALLRAEQTAPADVRYRPPVHRMVEYLLRADRRRALPDLPAFARRIGFHTVG